MEKKKLTSLATILFLAAGFASVSTYLYVNGTLKIAANQDDFEVYYSQAKVNGEVDNSVIIDETHIVFTKEMKDVGDEYTLEYDVTNSSKNYDADVEMSCTGSSDYLEVNNSFDDDTNLAATETRTGTLKIKLVKSYTGSEEKVNIACTINANAVERTSKATGAAASKANQNTWVLTDNDNDNTVSLGDLITVGETNKQSFYVYNVDGDTVKALAEYNLLVGNTYDGSTMTALTNPTGLQDSTALGKIATTPYIGVTAFGDNNTYSGSIVEGYISTYLTKLNKEYNANITSASLITKDELYALGCNSNTEACLTYIYTCESGDIPSEDEWYTFTDKDGNQVTCNTVGQEIDMSGTAPTWIAGMTYWVEPGASGNGVDYNGKIYSLYYAYSNSTGVRPTITLSKSLLQ